MRHDNQKKQTRRNVEAAQDQRKKQRVDERGRKRKGERERERGGGDKTNHPNAEILRSKKKKICNNNNNI